MKDAFKEVLKLYGMSAEMVDSITQAHADKQGRQLSIYLSIYLYIYLSLYLSIFLSNYLTVLTAGHPTLYFCYKSKPLFNT